MISIVIPLFGSPGPAFRDLLQDLIEAIRPYLGAEILVVQSAAPALAVDPPCRIIHSHRRLLPAEAKNRGAFAAQNGYLCFIDADNRVAPDCLDRLLKRASTHDFAAVAAATHYLEAPETTAFFGAFHSRWTNRTRFARERPQGSDLVTVEVVANAYIVETDAFRAIGGFDEAHFPTHFEESDLSLRLSSETGRPIVADVTAVVWNDMPLAARNRLSAKDWRRSYYNARSRVLFTARHHPFAAWLFFALCGQYLYAVLYSAAELRSLRGGARRYGASNIIAYWLGMLSGTTSSLELLYERAEVRSVGGAPKP